MESQANRFEDCAIVCAGIGHWYAKGVERLNTSLDAVGYTGARFMFTDYQPEWVRHEDIPYGFKIDAIQHAINAGYSKILWLDASMYAVNDVQPIFDKIQQDGYYFVKNGFNCAQECNDNSLNYFMLNRDMAEMTPIVATGCVGLNFENEHAINVFKFWQHTATIGIFNGSRQHDNQSSDPRFLHHRQDQSALSLVISHYEIEFMKTQDRLIKHEFGNEVAYNSPNIDKSKHILLCQGM